MVASEWATRKTRSVFERGAARRPAKECNRAMENAEAFEKFKACAVDVLQVTPEKVTPEARFGDDLDADSLDLVELVMALEEEFGVEVPEEELEGVETVGQAYDLIAGKLP